MDLATIACAIIANVFFICSLSRKNQNRAMLFVGGCIPTLLGGSHLFREVTSGYYGLTLITLVLTIPLMVLVARRFASRVLVRRNAASGSPGYAPGN
jgi:hypothetical protein